jgi:hypothetical protein
MPAPTVAKTQLIIDWAAAAGWDIRQELGYPVLPGPEIVISPDRAVFVTPVTGPGYVTEEGSADAWGFQARFRGPADDPMAPELAAQQWEAMVMNALYPVQIDGVWISHIHRLAGPPVPLPPAPPDRRFEYTCDYLTVTGA